MRLFKKSRSLSYILGFLLLNYEVFHSQQCIYVTSFTITTFNMLAAVHRSMDINNTRESERREWWQPRAESIAQFIANELVSVFFLFVGSLLYRVLHICFFLF